MIYDIIFFSEFSVVNLNEIVLIVINYFHFILYLLY